MIIPPKSSPKPVPFSDEDTGHTRSDVTTPHEPRVASEQSLIGLVMEPCAMCRHEFTTDKLWPVVGIGRTCDPCIALLRDQEHES